MYGALFELCHAFDFWFLSITKFGMTTKFIMNVFVDNTHTQAYIYMVIPALPYSFMLSNKVCAHLYACMCEFLLRKEPKCPVDLLCEMQ